MKIELGKRYVRRDGKVTGPMEYSNRPFKDPCTAIPYTQDGDLSTYREDADDISILKEYIEPVKIETWGVCLGTPGVYITSKDKYYLMARYPGHKIIKLMEVPDEV